MKMRNMMEASELDWPTPRASSEAHIMQDRKVRSPQAAASGLPNRKEGVRSRLNRRVVPRCCAAPAAETPEVPEGLDP